MTLPEVGKSAIEALKGSPALLAVVLLNIACIIAALAYLRTEQRQMDLVLERCLAGKPPIPAAP